MYRLRDKNRTPPKGFVWVDPITTFPVEARSYSNWRSMAIDHRSANAQAIPSEEEMEDQLCRRYDAETRQRICVLCDGTSIQPILGVGGTLKAMLAAIGISACWSCIDTAAQMDKWGPDGCEEHMGEIVAVMNANAARKNWLRFVPFKEAGAEMLVQLAIKKVRDRG